MSDGQDELWYPTVDDIRQLHDDIIQEDPDATAGVEDEERVEFAIQYVQDGHFGEVPETVHEKAFHLMRLLASNHWFADGNKRTALNTTELFYLVNGYELDYGEDVRSMLKLFSVRETLIDQDAGPAYLKDQTSVVEPDEDGERWGELLVLVAVALAEYLDIDVADELPDDAGWNLQEELGLTTFSDGTVNNGGDEANTNDGR